MNCHSLAQGQVSNLTLRFGYWYISRVQEAYFLVPNSICDAQVFETPSRVSLTA